MAEQTYDEKILEVVADEEAVVKAGNLVTLSTGVVLRIVPVPVLRVQAIINRFKYPPVPELWDDKRERNIRNPNSPEYAEARQQIEIERTFAIIDAVLVTGTEIAHRPDNVAAMEDDEWIDILEVTHVLAEGSVRKDSPASRYLAWAKYVAIGSAEDMVAVTSAAGMNMGTSEAKVAGALQGSFPDN